MKVLVSVRDAHEAALVARAGVDFIDLKEPSLGALGGLPVETVAALLRQIRRDAPATPVTATIGDWPAEALDEITERVLRVAATGVDQVKVGVERGPGALALLDRLATLKATGTPVVPVLIADDGIDPARLRLAAAGGFAAVMLDTADKRGGSLLDRVPAADLQHFIATVRATGALAGLAGALRLEEIPTLRRLGADFAGFRSAVCGGGRGRAVDEALLRGIWLAA